jgi:DNA-binding CsgD family transcriptional regulator
LHPVAISPHTVSTHRKNMLARTGCDNMTMLLRMLREKGLL